MMTARLFQAALFLAMLLLLLSGPEATRAQQKYSLTLAQSIDLAIRHGYAATDVAARYLTAKKTAESSRRKLWTSVDLNLTAPDFSESLSQQFNPITGRYEFYRLKNTNVQGTLSIAQPITLTGGTLTLSQLVLGRDQTSGLTSAALQGRDYFGRFFVEFRQPVFTPNQMAIQKTRATVALDQAESDFLKDQLDLVYNVTASFYMVTQLARRREIVGEQVRQNDESYQTARNKYAAGLIPEVEVLQSEVDLASSRNDSLNTEQALEQAKNAFRLLTGIATADEVEVTGDVDYRPVAIDLDRAVASALQNRSEVLGAQRSVDLREGDIGLARSQRDLKVDLVARYGLNRDDQLLSNIFHDFDRTRSASVTVSLPVFDWGSNSLAVEAAEAQHRNAVANQEYVRQQVGQEIVDLVNRIQVAESRIQVLEKTVAVAQKGYDISMQRFRNGTISRNDLAQSQQRLTAAKMNSLAALIDYQLGLADLKRKTLWDFEANRQVEPVIIPEE